MKLNLKIKPSLPKFSRANKNKSTPTSSKARFLTPFFSKVKAIFSSIVNFFRQEKVRKIIGTSVLVLAVIVFLFEITFAGLIYFGKINNNYVKTVAKIIPYPMVLVNFNAVTINDYLFESAYIEHFYSQSQREIPAEISSQIIDQLVDTKILETKAPSYGVKISGQEIDDTISELINQSGGQEEVEKVLSSYYGLSLKEFRTLVRDQLLRMKMQEAVPIQLQASHILIKVDKAADQATVDAAKAKADGIYNELKAGADFAEKAKAISDDTGSRDQGGDLGWFGRGDMVSQFEEKAYSMQVNEISEPIRTDYGWHIIKITDRKGFEDKSFDDWLAELRKDAFIKQLVNF